MKQYITDEQMKTIDTVNSEFSGEYEVWCEENLDELMGWFFKQEDTIFERHIQRFGYHCASEFMKHKENVVEA